MPRKCNLRLTALARLCCDFCFTLRKYNPRRTLENFRSRKFSRTCAAVLQLLLYSSQVPSIRLDQLRPMEAIIFKTSVRTSAG